MPSVGRNDSFKRPHDISASAFVEGLEMRTVLLWSAMFGPMIEVNAVVRTKGYSNDVQSRSFWRRNTRSEPTVLGDGSAAEIA